MNSNRLVYSTDGGRMDRCATCGKKRDACRCSRKSAAPPNDGVVRVSRDARHRRGKTVTVIAGLPGGDAAVQELAASLKRLCGAGGTVREGVVEIQGDHRDQLAARLRDLGYQVKLSGG